jgi:ferredoxin-type protein NapH
VIRPWRNAVQAGALLTLVAVPLVNVLLESDVVQGWYQSMAVAGLAFVSPLEGLETILVSRRLHVPLLVGLIPAVLIALVLGRVFCSWACPAAFLQEMTDRLLGRRAFGRLALPRWTIWLVLAADLVLAVALATPFFAVWSPPGLVGRELFLLVFFRTLAWEGVVIVAVLALNLLWPRLFCRHLCPLGGLLAGLGAWRALRVSHVETRCDSCGDCDPVCPVGLTPTRESETAQCWSCGTCVDTCGKGGLVYRFRLGAGRRPR